MVAAIFAFVLYPPKGVESLKDTNAVTLPYEAHIPININTASREELCLLEGIGEAMAQRIIAYRLEQGAFEAPEDIMRVRGIKEKTFENIQAYICVE